MPLPLALRQKPRLMRGHRALLDDADHPMLSAKQNATGAIWPQHAHLRYKAPSP